ncbi:AAA family ATPase [Streptomyces cucumeris]|uniref:AAA family ATPase n=1 Tax=Streptomyces cucumeris TaxID=2962890 RepID=UPI003D71A588
MTVHGQGTFATSCGPLPVRRGRAPSAGPVRPGRRAVVHDLRTGGDSGEDTGGGRGAEAAEAAGTAPRDGGATGAAVPELRYPAHDVLVASGLPGSGKTTLIHRTVAPLDDEGGAVVRIDSQDMREAWQRRLPGWLPYALYRPLVRCAHYAGLRRALRSDASVVVHDCGALPWVRRWLARDTRRRGRRLHMVLLDVDPELALEGQAARGRGVSGYAFGRHRRAVRRLVAGVEAGRPPAGCASVVLLDREATSALRGISFE